MGASQKLAATTMETMQLREKLSLDGAFLNKMDEIELCLVLVVTAMRLFKTSLLFFFSFREKTSFILNESHSSTLLGIVNCYDISLTSEPENQVDNVYM